MGEVTRGTAAPTAGRGAALAALASTAGACALLIFTGLGGSDTDDGAGDRRGGGKVSAPRPAAGATAPIGDSRVIAASYPWPALFAIGGYPEPSRKGDRRRGARAEGRERTRARAARRQARARADRAERRQAGADRTERRRVAEELARRGLRGAPARAREPRAPARSPRVVDRPRREVRGEVMPAPAPAPKRAPAPRAAPPAADPAPPSGSPERAEDGEPSEQGGARGRQQLKPAGGAPSGADQR